MQTDFNFYNQYFWMEFCRLFIAKYKYLIFILIIGNLIHNSLLDTPKYFFEDLWQKKKMEWLKD